MKLLLAALLAIARYNDPLPPEPRAPLVGHIEELVRKLAPEGKRPEVDPRLERATVEIARRAPKNGPPPNELVEAALWLNGIIEPPPHLIVVSMSDPREESALLDELRGQLPKIFSTGNYRRVGAAAELVGNQTNIVLALQESFVELQPVPRALPSGGEATLKGKLRGAYVRPEVLVTAPGGQVQPLFVAARNDVTQFTATLHCLEVGRHQVEIVADDKFGPSVLANFPVDCGVPAPSELVAGQRLDDAPAMNATQAEAELGRLMNADRARAGLAPLELDPRLSQVARSHSRDMVQHHFVGHVSPSTGSAADRLHNAKVATQLVLENVARAYSPGEVERGWMESPGHRANILSREVDRFGVGVTLGDVSSGVREIFATQLFIKAPRRYRRTPPKICRAASRSSASSMAWRRSSRTPT